MRTHQVYDLPTRLFHWLFAAFFVFAFVVAKNVDDESPVFTWHMLAGMGLSFMVVLRILWGLVGTRYARFAGFDLNPAHLIVYLKGILTGDKTTWTGHNPASSWAALVMLVLALCLGLTGYLMTSGSDKETYEDIHELLANAFLLTVLLHIGGVMFHAVRHRDQIFFAMVDGKKASGDSVEVISDTRHFVGVGFVVAVVGFMTLLAGSYDVQTGKLSLVGQTLQLGDSIADEGDENGADGNEAIENDNDDDDGRHEEGKDDDN
jgi:cytochrome b